MLRAIEFFLGGEIHRIDLMQNVTDPNNPKLELDLTCPACGIQGTLEKDHFIGKVSIKCVNNLNEPMGLDVEEGELGSTVLKRKYPKKQGDHKVCQFHETHNYLEIAKKQIEALERWVKK